MSQSALLSLINPVQPQASSTHFVGQGGSALLGEGVLSADAGLFAGLLARASEGDNAASVASLAGPLGSFDHLSTPDRDLTLEENSQNVVAGLIPDLQNPAVSQNSSATLSLIGNTQVAVEVKDKGNAPFVPLPDVLKTQMSGETKLEVAGTGGAHTMGTPVAGEVEADTSMSREGLLAALQTGQVVKGDLAASDADDGDGQILPQVSEEGAKEPQIANPKVRGETETGKAAVSPALASNASGNSKVVDTVQSVLPIENVGRQHTEATQTFAADTLVKASPDVTEDVSETVLRTKGSGDIHSSQQAQDVVKPTKTTDSLTDRVLDGASKPEANASSNANASSAVRAGLTENADKPAQAVSDKVINDLPKIPEVTSVKVEVGTVQTQKVNEPSVVEVEASPVSNSKLGSQNFVGGSPRSEPSVTTGNNEPILFPNVVAKVETNADAGKVSRIGQVQPEAKLNNIKVPETSVRSAATVSRNVSASTAAISGVQKNKVTAPSARVLQNTQDAGEASGVTATDTEDMTFVQNKSAERVVTTNRETGAPVTVQVKVPQATTEQGAVTTGLGWGMGSMQQDGAEVDLEQESSDAMLISSSRSEAASRAITSLPTSTLRNVSSSVWPEIARQASGGVSRFEIRLDPQELGGVDVSLEFGKDGRVRAHLMVERPETLELLQRDQRGLEKALQEAGLDSEKSSLQFSLNRGGGGTQNSASDQQHVFGHSERTSDEALLADAAIAAQNNMNRSTRTGGLDISV